MTSGYPWTAWLLWVGGALVALGGLTLLIWSLYWDRSRGRRRCPRCWYDMSATPGLTCSECGKVVKRERKLLRTRRRWRLAIVALLGVLSGGWLTLMPKADRDGWWSLVPNRVLIAGLPLASSIDDFWCKELARRVQLSTGVRNPAFTSRFGTPNYKLSKSDWEAFFNRCVAGDWWARPTSDDWIAKYGELIHVWTDGSFHLPDELPKSVEHKLLELPPKLIFRTREVWPEDAAVYVECVMENWWPYGSALRAQATPRIKSSQTFQVFRHRQPYVAPQEFKGDELVFDVVIERGKEFRSWESLEPWRQEVARVPLIVRGTTADQVNPVSSAPMSAAVGAMSYRLTRQGGKTGSIGFDPTATNIPLFQDVALAVTLEFMLDGQVIVRQHMWWKGGQGPTMTWTPSELTGDTKRLVHEAKPGENWQIRIRSDPQLALRILDCNQFWEGEMTIPLTIVDQ